MKKLLPVVAIISLMLCACDKKDKETSPEYMQVEGKIFYQEGMTGSWFSYYHFFTKDSVHHLRLKEHHSYGTYKQTNDKVVMYFEGAYAPTRAHIEDDMLVVGIDYYTQTNPETL